MQRLENWRRLLHEMIEKRHDYKFSYGLHDCCLGPGACIKAITGVDVARGYKGYRDELGAQKVLDENGGVLALASKIAKSFNMPEVKISRAGAGDVVVFLNHQGMETLGVIGTNGRDVYAAKKPKGWAIVSKKKAIKAWRV